MMPTIVPIVDPTEAAIITAKILLASSAIALGVALMFMTLVVLWLSPPLFGERRRPCRSRGCLRRFFSTRNQGDDLS